MTIMHGHRFKFIVPKGKEDELKNLFPGREVSERASANGNYSSLTFQMMCPSSEAVINVYKTVAHIEGIIAL